MNEILKLVGRSSALLTKDLELFEEQLTESISNARVLVLGGAGSIGQNVTKEIFKRQPKSLHVVDISENNSVELVRDIRSSLGYIEGDTQFLPISMGSREYEYFWESNAPYDYVFNLAAMKHVRSEKDPFSLMRMIKTNILYTQKTYQLTKNSGAKKYFAVSTDKAENPANLMGATKRLMEVSLAQLSHEVPISTARFANVAFSDGSLLHGFNNRIAKNQPISAPNDVRRYFMTGYEAGLVCLFSAVVGQANEIYFPDLDPEENLITFSEIAKNFLRMKGFEPVELNTEDEARASAADLIRDKKWPCYFFASDTSGEKPFEEFYSPSDTVNWDRHIDLGVIDSITDKNERNISEFIDRIIKIEAGGVWDKDQLTSLIKEYCPTLDHVDTGKTLDGKM